MTSSFFLVVLAIMALSLAVYGITTVVPPATLALVAVVISLQTIMQHYCFGRKIDQLNDLAAILANLNSSTNNLHAATNDVPFRLQTYLESFITSAVQAQWAAIHEATAESLRQLSKNTPVTRLENEMHAIRSQMTRVLEMCSDMTESVTKDLKFLQSSIPKVEKRIKHVEFASHHTTTPPISSSSTTNIHTTPAIDMDRIIDAIGTKVDKVLHERYKSEKYSDNNLEATITKLIRAVFKDAIPNYITPALRESAKAVVGSVIVPSIIPAIKAAVKEMPPPILPLAPVTPTTTQSGPDAMTIADAVDGKITPKLQELFTALTQHGIEIQKQATEHIVENCGNKSVDSKLEDIKRLVSEPQHQFDIPSLLKNVDSQITDLKSGVGNTLMSLITTAKDLQGTVQNIPGPAIIMQLCELRQKATKTLETVERLAGPTLPSPSPSPRYEPARSCFLVPPPTQSPTSPSNQTTTPTHQTAAAAAAARRQAALSAGAAAGMGRASPSTPTSAPGSSTRRPSGITNPLRPNRRPAAVRTTLEGMELRAGELELREAEEDMVSEEE